MDLSSSLRVIGAQLKELAYEGQPISKVTFDFASLDRQEAVAVVTLPSNDENVRSLKATLRVDLSGRGLK